MSAGDRSPVLRVTAGTPSDAELAAVLVAVQSLGSPAAAPPVERRPSRWIDRSRAMGTLPAPGPGAWAASARPR